MYLRFVTHANNERSGLPEGIFQAAYRLRREKPLGEAEADELSRHLVWFDEYLDAPGRFNRTSSKGWYRRNTRGISWIKDTATEHIQRLRKISDILDRHGVLVEMIRTDRLGVIIHEDDFQVVAEPFRETTVEP